MNDIARELVRIARALVSAKPRTDREVYEELEDSTDKGVSGVATLLQSIWDIDGRKGGKVDWNAVKGELGKLPSGKSVVKGMEALPYFDEISSGKYREVEKKLGKGFGEVVRAWEDFEKKSLRPIEDEWVDHHR